MIKISLVIPTYNRSEYLKKSLPTFLNQTMDNYLYEIILVDNNSTDNTKEIANELLKNAKCSWQYVSEPRQGLHNARNTGIRLAKGSIIVFGDDDIMAENNWLKTLLEEFEQHPKTGIAGGKILPKWTKEPPEWIYDYGTKEFHGIFAYFDIGKERKILGKNEYVVGCNFAIRKDLALKIGGSQPDTFPSSLMYLSGYGECGMIRDVGKLGADIVYLPEALVYHHADASRATIEYFIDRYKRWAIENVYYNFRYFPKKRAIIRILKNAKDNFKISLKKNVDKINPNYYKLIMYNYSKMIIIQLLRVLIDKKLYNYIVKESYFD